MEITSSSSSSLHFDRISGKMNNENHSQGKPLMITGELHSKIDCICDDFWSGGISNPLTANMSNTPIERPVFPQDRSLLRWSRFKDMEARDMFENLKPHPDDIICDPASGISGFLVEASEFLREDHKKIFLDDDLMEHFNSRMFYGNDFDVTMLRIGVMNLLLHGIENPNLTQKDSLSKANADNRKRYTVGLRFLKRRSCVIVMINNMETRYEGKSK